MKVMIKFFCVICLVSCALTGAGAEQKKERITKHTVAPKEVVGEVTGITQGRFISIMYNMDQAVGGGV